MQIQLTIEQHQLPKLHYTTENTTKQRPIFFPTKEVISMYPNFGGLYRDYHIEIDETYYDLCLALERPLLKNIKQF